jgi:hypothetical protein
MTNKIKSEPHIASFILKLYSILQVFKFPKLRILKINKLLHGAHVANFL